MEEGVGGKGRTGRIGEGWREGGSWGSALFLVPGLPCCPPRPLRTACHREPSTHPPFQTTWPWGTGCAPAFSNTCRCATRLSETRSPRLNLPPPYTIHEDHPLPPCLTFCACVRTNARWGYPDPAPVGVCICVGGGGGQNAAPLVIGLAVAAGIFAEVLPSCLHDPLTLPLYLCVHSSALAPPPAFARIAGEGGCGRSRGGEHRACRLLGGRSARRT